MNENDFNEIPTPNRPVNNKVEEKKEELFVSDISKEVNTLQEGKEAIKKETNSFIAFFKDFYKYVTTHKISDLTELLIYALIIAGFIVILSIPFDFLKELFFNALVLFGVNFDANIQQILNNVWGMFYLFIAIFLFLILSREKFYQMIANKKEIADLKKEVNK